MDWCVHIMTVYPSPIVCVCLCRCSGKTERGESQWDRSALGWHTVRQTHFITGLFTWLTGLLYQLHSTLQHTTVSNTPTPWKLPSLPHPHKQTHMQFANTKPGLTDWLFEWVTSSPESKRRAWIPIAWPSQWMTSNTPPCRPELMSALTS